jgi:hypothetical protein
MYHTHTPLACSRKHYNAAYEASLSLNPDKTGGSAHHQTAIDKSCSFCHKMWHIHSCGTYICGTYTAVKDDSAGIA